MSARTMNATMPLADLTNKHQALANQQQQPMQKQPLGALNANTLHNNNNGAQKTFAALCQHQKQQQTPVVARTNDPYSWTVLPRDEEHAEEILRIREREAQQSIFTAAQARLQAQQRRLLLAQQQQQQQQQQQASFSLPEEEKENVTPSANPTPAAAASSTSQFPAAPAASTAKSICNVLVQFKCHHAEFGSAIPLMKGQFVCVGGDRGVDIGIVIRINTEENKTYVEKTGPTGHVLRHATQREVDYWSTDLKADEQAALEYVRGRVAKHRLVMEVKHAEYQFDKKKLTFYYESKARVDFVQLLKDLFREFSCRIWMEKVRTGVHEQ